MKRQPTLAATPIPWPRWWGAIVGAYRGESGLKPEWIAKVLTENAEQEKLIDDMTDIVLKRYDEKKALIVALDQI